MRSHLLKLIRYGRWADDTLLQLLLEQGAPDEAARLFEHIIAAQELWLGRVKGDAADVTLWDSPAPARWRARIDAVSRQWLMLIADHDDFQRPIPYRTTSGAPYATPLVDIVTHLSIHGQHHRAQVARVLRLQGTPPPPLDYIVYARDVAPAAERS